MEGNESNEEEKHETGSKENENLELISSIAADDGHNQDNVISKN